MEKIKSILSGSFPNDLLADKDGKEKNISERTGKAYNYLIEHTNELSFKEFEEMFFYLLFTSYKYERNLESPEIQLLSFKQTDDNKIKYISLICKLMERQFKEYLSFPEPSKNKGRLLPEFTYYFGMPFWKEIKSIAEEALQFVPNGEIANRERLIAETAIQCRQRRNAIFHNGPTKKFDYKPYEKYLDLQIQSEFSISDCFVSDEFTTKLPKIRQYYNGDHHELYEKYNQYNDNSYEQMKRAYHDKIFHHAFACPALLNFFDFDENWLEIGTKLERTNKELEEKEIKLQKSNKELKEAQEDKKQVINEFAHTYSNMKATTLHEMGTFLLNVPSEKFRDYGRLALVEYSIKTNLTKEIKMLQLRFENKVQQLIQDIQNTIYSSPDETTIQIQDIVSDAWKRCFMTLLYDESSKGIDWCNLFFNTEDHKDVKENLKKNFEKAVLVQSDRYGTISWIEHSKTIDFQFSVAGLWKNLYFKSDEYAALLLTDWISELFTNVIRYADRNQPVMLNCTNSEEMLCIHLQNKKNSAVEIHNTQRGISSLKAYVHELNQNSGFSGDSVQIIETKTSYEIKIYLKSEILIGRT